MRKGLCIAWLVALLGLLPAITYAAAETRPSYEGRAVFPTNRADSKRVTMEFKDTPAMEALTKLSKEADISFAIRGEIPKDLRVTIYLQNADARSAIRLACDAAGLSCNDSFPGSGFIISARPTATVSGMQLPVIGTMQAGGMGGGAMGSGSFSLHFADWGLRGYPPFPGDNLLVDLEVRDLPLSEVMAQLSKSIGLPIIVDKAVPEGLKVTAKIRSLPAGEVLSTLMQQARLTYSVGQGKSGKQEIHVIPWPELRVTGVLGIGEAVSGMGGGRGGGGGGGGLGGGTGEATGPVLGPE